MKAVKVTCDQCKKDLTTTGNCEGYRIALSSEPIPSCGGAVTAVAAHADFPQPLHFCGYKCFEQWAKSYFTIA
jgi:hypothetical protein